MNEQPTADYTPFDYDPEYQGNQVDNSKPLDGEWKTINKWQKFNFANPAELVSFFDPELRNQDATLHQWQIKTSVELAEANPTQYKPHKFALCAANGSGKDKYIVAPFVIWFALCKIRSRCIITSSSGTQLTAQTETYIRDLAERVNEFFGTEVFKINQRYLKCKLSGSEIRLFATDEKGKAEGYHPWDVNSEMAIIVNEGKSVHEDIFEALRRCTGYNYWVNVSTPGEPIGSFYRSCINWKHFSRITSFDCPHLSEDERKEDLLELGEHSSYYRSKHLALFTSLDGQVIIKPELLEKLKHYDKIALGQAWPKRIGVDLAAGGDENSMYCVRGNKILAEKHFRETDTTITADEIDKWLTEEAKVEKDHAHIYMDDGGVGHSIIDMLRRKGWRIVRVLNQSAARNKKLFGNKGSENWHRILRFFEEGYLPYPVDKRLRDQLTTRRYKRTLGSDRTFLEAKREAKANGRPSPDRADAYILAHSGLSVDDWMRAFEDIKEKPAAVQLSNAEILKKYEDLVTFKDFERTEDEKTPRANGSLQMLLRKQNR